MLAQATPAADVPAARLAGRRACGAAQGTSHSAPARRTSPRRPRLRSWPPPPPPRPPDARICGPRPCGDREDSMSGLTQESSPGRKMGPASRSAGPVTSPLRLNARKTLSSKPLTCAHCGAASRWPSPSRPPQLASPQPYEGQGTCTPFDSALHAWAQLRSPIRPKKDCPSAADRALLF